MLIPTTTENCGFETPGVCATFKDLPDGTRFHDQFFAEWDVTIMERRPETIELKNNRHGMTTELNFCGEKRTVSNLNDMAVICDGRLVSSVFSEGVAFMNVRSRLPFDFTGREGVVTFSADLALSTRQWLEVWITPEKPRYPGTRVEGDDLEPMERGIRLAFDHDSADVFQLHPGASIEVRVDDYDGFKRENDKFLNDVRIGITQDRIRIAVDGKQYVNKAFPQKLDWSQAYVIFQQFSYNPHKDCPHNDFDCEKNTLNWGHLGFDGAPPTDVKAVGTDENTVFWVDNLHDRPGKEPIIVSTELEHPTGGEGVLRFSAIGQSDKDGANEFRINGGEWMQLKETDRCWAWRTFNVPATILKGKNKVEFRSFSKGSDPCFPESWRGFAVHRVDLEVLTEK